MLLAIGLRNLFRNFRRTVAILITLIMGTGALYLFHGFNVGTANQYREDVIHSRYGHGQINTPSYLDSIHEKPWKHWIENPESVAKILRTHPSVTHVFPRIEFFALLSNGRRSISGRGQAVNGVEEAEFFNTLNIEEGKNLSTEEEGIILGKGIAKSLGVKVGDSLTVLANTIRGSMNGSDLTVVGIFHTGQKDFDDTYFRVPLQKGFELLDTQAVESISIGLKSYEDWPAFEKFFKRQNSGLEATSFAILDKVYYQNTIDWLEAQFQFIQLIILFIIFLGILNTVSLTVLERKQEIGNLRANGESVIDIIRLLSAEGFVIGLFGSVLGIITATVLNMTLLKKGIPMPPGPGQTRAFYTLIELQPDMGGKIIIMGIVAALIGTLFAGIRVVRIPIGEALRSV